MPQSVFKWAKLTQSFYGSLEKLQPDSRLIVAFLQRENQMWKLWDLRESWRSACFPLLLFWLMPVCFHLFYSFLPTLTHTGNTDWDAGGFRCILKSAGENRKICSRLMNAWHKLEHSTIEMVLRLHNWNHSPAHQNANLTQHDTNSPKYHKIKLNVLGLPQAFNE